MFSQNNKKQTTLGFAIKPAPGRATSASTKTRPTPYSRAPMSKSASVVEQRTTSKSPYFDANTKAKSYRAPRADSFGLEVSSKVNSYRYGSTDNAKLRADTTGKGSRNTQAKVPLPHGVTLSERQQEAFNLAVNQRSNMFITGSAGTGKSILLREVIKALEAVTPGGKDSVVVTASTGIAAFNIGGKTIHSFSGVGIGKGSPDALLKFVKKSRMAKERWERVQVLIIDEISMLDASLFDGLEYIARKMRGNERYFGGVQVILTGDFYQLPPVDRTGMGKLAFESDAWARGITQTVVLTHVFRQKDMRFVDMLNEIRLGKLSDQSLDAFRQLGRIPQYPADGIQATELYALRNEVEDANLRRLQALQGTSNVYHAHDQEVKQDKVVSQSLEEEIRKKIDGNTLVPRRIELRVKAQVMLVKNRPEDGLVNGSRGVVTSFKAIGGRDYPIVRFTTGAELMITPETAEVDISNRTYQRVQMPLILAWALSIHKSQGQTIDRLKVDLGKVFEKGQAYVALSRAVSLDSLQVLNFRPGCVMAHPRVIQYYADLSRKLQ